MLSNRHLGYQSYEDTNGTKTHIKENRNIKDEPYSTKILHRLLLWYLGHLGTMEIQWA